ncbi:MAG: gliding motility-associated C-terminal domain-containing protein [Bacteroidetes bacterium]|nr:MAG: gliding motility-associated C-terminal domain-containing protein [Bacteroidota bacterium]
MKLPLQLRWLFIAIMSMAGTASFGQATQFTQTPNASVCTGDSLTMTLTVFPTYLANNSFSVFLTPGNAATADFTNAATEELPIAKWIPNTGFPASDTNDAGTKQLTVIIPETITTNGTYSIRIESDNPATISNNVFEVAVNVTIPASIDSIRGGFDNVYTPGDTTDWGRCTTDTVILYANPGFNYQWYLNGVPVRIAQPGRTDDRLDSLVVYAPGDYYVEVSSGPVCPGTSEHQLILNYIPAPVIQTQISPWVEVLDDPANLLIDSIQFCEADSVLLYGLPEAFPLVEDYQYRWLRDSVNAMGFDSLVPIKGGMNDSIWITSDIVNQSVVPNYMRFYLEVTELNSGCVAVSEFPRYFFMDTIPDVDFSAIPWPGETSAPTTICIEDSILFRANTIGGSDYHYQWQVQYPLGNSWQNLINDTLPELQVDTALVPDSAVYRLRIDNFTCTYWSVPIQVNVVPNPFFQFLPGDSVALCPGDSVLVAVNGNGLQYTWSDGFIGQSRYVSTPGSMWVQSQGVNQCRYYDTLVVYPLVVNASAGPDQTIGIGDNVQMAASGGVTYRWYADKPVYFSDDRDPNTLSRPVEDTTKYYVEVTGANGCTAIDSMMVYVEDPFGGNPNLSNVQNVMTPNGDGINDYLDLSEVIKTDNCELTIMNRWGATVYTEENYSNGWSGTNDGGDELSDGTYYFLLTCGDEVRFKGPITLIRNND